MTPFERKFRLAVAAVGIAMVVTTVGLVFVLLPQEDIGVRVWMASAVGAPLSWSAATVLFLPPHPSGWQRLVGRMILIVYLATGVILACGVAAVLGRYTAIDFLAVAFSLPLCIHLPVGLVCLGYLVVLVTKRLLREPEEGDE